MSFCNKALAVLCDIPTNETNLHLLNRCLDQLVPFVGAGLSVEFGYPTWGQFLRLAAVRFDVTPEIEALLGRQQFEEAAELLIHCGVNKFDDFLEQTFDHNKIPRPLTSKGAVHQVARIARGPVLTTNFDRVLETVFQGSGRGFQEIFPGSRIREASRAVQCNTPVLLKMHGDYLDSSNRVLTLSEYSREYGSESPGCINFELPLPRLLSQAIGARPLLFLGCSLRCDRTTLIIAQMAKKLQGIVHFALLSASEYTPDRLRELDAWNIRPLFFPAGEFNTIELFLAYLGDGITHSAGLRNRARLMVPKQPPAGFVPRPREFEEAKARLLQNCGPQSVALSTAFTGAGGYGKTTLAQALCADDDIRRTFAEGIFWIDVGQTPNILGILGGLFTELTDSTLITADEREASTLVARELASRSVLMVIDDVWQTRHLKAFLDAAPSSKFLITTRIVEILEEEVSLVRVDEMLPDQAVDLLLKGIKEQTGAVRSSLHDLAHRLGYWALLLELANAKLRTFLRRRGGALEAALAFVVSAYQRCGLVAFDRRDPIQRNQAAGKSIELTLDLLDQQERANYFDLGIFPEDTAVPVAVAAELWGMDIWNAETALLRFDDLSLVKYFANDQSFRLHDVLYDWLRRQSVGPAIHARLLERWRNFYDLPHSYAWRWIIWHLKGAEQLDGARRLLLDITWIEAKLEHVGLQSLIADYGLVQTSEPHRLMKRALTQSSHVITESREQLSEQLYARLLSVTEPELTEIRVGLSSRLGCLIPLWPTFTQADAELVRTLTGHTDVVMSMAFSGNGQVLLSGSRDKTIKIWDLETGRLLRTLEGHADWVTSVALSYDGMTAVSGSYDKTVKVWDASSGRLLRTLEAHESSVTSIALSRDESTIVSGSFDHTVRVWELSSGRLICDLGVHRGEVMSVAIGNNGEMVASASNDRTVKVWSLRTRSLIWVLEGHTGEVMTVALSGDCRTLASGSYDKTIKVWDTTTGRLKHTLKGHMGWILSLALSDDARTLISGSEDKTIRVWDIETERAIKTLEGHIGWITSVALTRSGHTLASGSNDYTIRLWEPEKGRLGRTFRSYNSWVWSVVLNNDCDIMVSGSEDKMIRIWSIGDGKVLRTLKGHAGDVTAVTLSHDQRLLVSGSSDNTVKIWDFSTGEVLHTLAGHSGWVTSVALSSDGCTLISGSTDTTIKIWDIQAGRIIGTLEGHRAEVRSVALSPDGRILVSGSDDNTIRVWDISGKRLVRELRGHSGWVMSVVLNRQADTIISGSRDNTVKIWDAHTGQMKSTLKGHTSGVKAVALGPDELKVISGSRDSSIKVWDLRTGTCQNTFSVESTVMCLAFSPMKNILGAGDAAGHVYLFQVDIHKD